MNTENQNIVEQTPEQGSGEVIIFKNKDVTENSSEKIDSDISIRLKNENGDFVKDQKSDLNEPTTPAPKPSNTQHLNNVQRSAYNPCMADTHSRIFGESQPSHETPYSSPRRVSTVTFQGLSTDTVPEKIEKAHFYGKKSVGNPLTGEGYDTDMSNQRTKMPPGGPSSPLW